MLTAQPTYQPAPPPEFPLLYDPANLPAGVEPLSAERHQELRKYATAMVNGIEAVVYRRLNELSAWIKKLEMSLRTKTTTVAQLLELFKISDKTVGMEFDSKTNMIMKPVLDVIAQVLYEKKLDDLRKQGITGAKLDWKQFKAVAWFMLNELPRKMFAQQQIRPLGPQTTKAEALKIFGITGNETVETIVNKSKAALVKAITSELVGREILEKLQKGTSKSPTPVPNKPTPNK